MTYITYHICSARCGAGGDENEDREEQFVSTITNADIESMGREGLALRDDDESGIDTNYGN